MQLLFIVPFLISLYYVLRNQPEKAFLNIYLPCILLVPTYYTIRFPHLPPISCGAGALIPIAISVLIRPKIRWSFKRMDLWIILFMVSVGLSEVLREFNPKDGILVWIKDFLEMFFPYVVGRQLIEPKLRLETVKRIVVLFVCLTPMALFEYRFGLNPWLIAFFNVFHLDGIDWQVGMRGGHARVATSFGHAILAGICFGIAIALDYYLVQIYRHDKQRLGPLMSMLQKYHIPFLVLCLMLYLTGSRMPMATAALGFVFLQIPMFKNMKAGAAIVLLIVAIGGGAGYLAFQKYTSGKETNDEAVNSALYRKQLLVNYAPILEEGGWLGFGTESFPRVGGQASIDNDYLYLQLGQGKLGKYSFILLGLEAGLSLAICAFRFKSRESLFLVFSVLGSLLVIFVSLTTVALFEQVILMLFLLLGWSQSLQDTSAVNAGVRSLNQLPEPKFRFKRVIA